MGINFILKKVQGGDNFSTTTLFSMIDSQNKFLTSEVFLVNLAKLGQTKLFILLWLQSSLTMEITGVNYIQT